eukprot:TRINITY_DN26723_c0_g2_i1.p1 TRINITY_DN26723_c0_g2~~TRINITY_DN26723_c0_g2_i1.p1  ORF type:complete len:449 (-),score=34.26 TRINITY_DN26723_c0_g2_i1:45-1391(-)
MILSLFKFLLVDVLFGGLALIVKSIWWMLIHCWQLVALIIRCLWWVLWHTMVLLWYGFGWMGHQCWRLYSYVLSLGPACNMLLFIVVVGGLCYLFANFFEGWSDSKIRDHRRRVDAELSTEREKQEREAARLARMARGIKRKRAEGPLVRHTVKIEMGDPPDHWECTKAEESQDGFALHELTEDTDWQVWSTLERLLETDGRKLGKGADVKMPGHYDRLCIARAWRLEHPVQWQKYVSSRSAVFNDMQRLRANDVEEEPGLPTKLSDVQLPGEWVSLTNESVLLHGTSPGVLLSILSTGPNERFSGSNAGTAYGDGVYLAEDVGKTDQYSSMDAKINPKDELHKRLYPDGDHPQKVFYVVVCRVALGHHVCTKEAGKNAKSVTDKLPVFPISFRELAQVPDVSPPVFYHSLLGTAFPRFREFVVFHSQNIYPEYVVAYHRFSGDRGPI